MYFVPDCTQSELNLIVETIFAKSIIDTKAQVCRTVLKTVRFLCVAAFILLACNLSTSITFIFICCSQNFLSIGQLSTYKNICPIHVQLYVFR